MSNVAGSGPAKGLAPSGATSLIERRRSRVEDTSRGERVELAAAAQRAVAAEAPGTNCEVGGDDENGGGQTKDRANRAM